MKSQAYKLDLIPPDLRREEAMLQIADALDYVQLITDDIFKTIETRVKEYSGRIKSVCDRADLAQKKINKFRGSSKATKVFSSYKYPGMDVLQNYKSLFSMNNSLQHKEQQSGQSIRSKHITPDDKIIKEKLQFYNVQFYKQEQEKEKQMTEEGLGSLPKELDSVSTLLLFNTSENPYKKYVMLDPLGAVTRTRKSLEEETQDDTIGAAPITISQREQMEAVDKENYFYSPGLGEVPEMDVPFALPHLSGIADDLSYSADLGPSIAPSFEIAPDVLLNLPSLVPESPLDVKTLAINLPDIDASPVAEQPPLPPPPPPPPPPVFTPTEETVKEVPKTQRVSNEEKKNAKTSESVAPAGDARANLLESIRQAGGSGKAKLRSAADRKLEAKKKKQEEKSTSGGYDLMSDLAKKLQMRRKGISGGAHRKDSVSDDSFPSAATADRAMEKVSAMIPPPPPQSSRQMTDDDDDEWD